jgi:hypothetical protein
MGCAKTADVRSSTANTRTPGEALSAGLILVLVVAAAYLAAHAASEWLARRYLIVSGAEYLLLGILLGPQVSGLIRTSVVESFAPILTLALGWTGAWVGTHFYLPRLVRTRGVVFRVAFFEAILSLATVAGIMTWVFSALFDVPMTDTVMPATALGAIAAASSSSGIALVSDRLGRKAAVMRQIEETTFIDALVAITAFSILLCLKHPTPIQVSQPPTATEWAVISVAIGLVGGALFYLFLGREREIDRLFISLAGAIILASGAAAYLRLSPLLPSLLIGAILINTSRNHETIARVMSAVARPLYFVLLIFAGTAWRPGTRALWLVPVGLFLVVRLAAKLGSARLSARLNGRLRTLGPDWGRALLGQGVVAVAIAVNYMLHDASLLPNVVFTAAIVSTLLTDVLSGRMAQSVVMQQLERLSARWKRLAQALDLTKT